MMLGIRAWHALVAVSLAALLFAGFWAAQSASDPPRLCMDSEMREHVRELLLAGLDQGLKQHTAGVYDIWVKDPAEQPRRATNGMHVGISAYIRSRAAVKNWNPPRCPEKQP